MRKSKPPFKNLGNIMFLPMPVGPVDVIKAITRNGVIAMIGAEGGIYTNAVLEPCIFDINQLRHLDLFLCCHRLGVLSPHACKQGLEATKNRKRNLRYRALSMHESAKWLGIKLTKQQAERVHEILDENVL